MRWRRQRHGEGFFAEAWTPDLQAERDERLGWAMRKGVPWKLLNSQLVLGRRYRPDVQRLLTEAMQVGRSEWKPRMRALAASGVATAAEGTYGALGAYPLPGEITYTIAGTTEAAMLSGANSALYMPIPANSVLAPQAYRFVIAGRVTTTTTAANLTWGIRLGNAVGGVSLGLSAAQAKGIVAMTNATWILKGDITITRVGVPGANGLAVGHFDAKVNSSAAGSAYTAWAWSTGSTYAAIDTTVAPNAGTSGGSVMPTLTASATTDAYVFQQVHWMDWN